MVDGLYACAMPQEWMDKAKEAFDPVARRSLIVEANDGIIATAGVIEGFAGAGATGHTLVVAACATMAAGAVAIAGARYAEEAAERDSQLVIVNDERHQLSIEPDMEMAELAAIYEAKGLSRDLALDVARQLSQTDALAAHVDAEYGIRTFKSFVSSVAVALAAGVAFALGAVVPLLAVLLMPDDQRAAATFAASLVALSISSFVMASLGHLSVPRVLVRTLFVGASAMGLSLFVGTMLDF